MAIFAQKYPRYPGFLFNILCTLQLIASGFVVVFFYVAWANIGNTAVLKEDLGLVEKEGNPNEWHAPWYFKLVSILFFGSYLGNLMRCENNTTEVT